MTSAYDSSAHQASRAVTRAYSTSFSSAARLFEPATRQAVYDIYGLVRLADELVDTYEGPDRAGLLDGLEGEVYAAMERSFSPNLIVQAFVLTALHYGIGQDLIAPFFASMRSDLRPQDYRPADYKAYIHGSAEVVGLMCLKVFVPGDASAYESLKPGAGALGAAFQKVNFLRDLAEDHHRLGRYYFPIGSFAAFDDKIKAALVKDIRRDFALAGPAVDELPAGARTAVGTAFDYYLRLLDRLDAMPAARLKQERPRLPNSLKLWLLLRRRFKLAD